MSQYTNINDISSDIIDIINSEAKTEIVINTSDKKNSWVWSFYRQIQISNGDIFANCEVEIDAGVKCNKRHKTKSSTGNLIINI